MEQINNILAKLGLSVKNALTILGAAVAVWLLLGGRKTVYRRARRTVKRTTSNVRRRYYRARATRLRKYYEPRVARANARYATYMRKAR